MRLISRLAAVILVLLAQAASVIAEDMMIDDFTSQPETRWRFFSDTVMGGVSTGGVRFLSEGGSAYARLTGQVSTANNGGFIQMRTELPGSAPEGSEGIRLSVRGNDQRYFVHLRTGGTILPWQYYQAGFDAPRGWAEIRLPFESFEPSGGLLRRLPRAQGLKSLGIVAFGRDHEAELDVREVGFY